MPRNLLRVLGPEQWHGGSDTSGALLLLAIPGTRGSERRAAWLFVRLAVVGWRGACDRQGRSGDVPAGRQ